MLSELDPEQERLEIVTPDGGRRPSQGPESADACLDGVDQWISKP